LSHIPQRREKDCLNCGTVVQGPYCHNCGQKNVVPHETFWHIAKHFVYDITNFDGNFFSTIKRLIFKPGFLSKEYIKGRRASYLHPIKMYVFTSAMFFLLFFLFFTPSADISINMSKPLQGEERNSYIKQPEDTLKKDTGNSLLKAKLAIAKDTARTITEKEVKDLTAQHFTIGFFDRTFKSMAEYDSVQQSLPPSQRDGWFMRRLMKKEIEINEKYRENPDEAVKKLADNILHRLPYMLFVSLPLFALILKLVYIRRRQFYYADHGIFTIHLYVFSLILLLLIFMISKLQDMVKVDEIAYLTALLYLLLFFYLYKAMRVFYGQGRWKTIVKFLIVSLFSILMMLVLLAIFYFFSTFTI